MVAALLVLASSALPAAAQDSESRLRDERERLEQLRREREQLQQRMSQLRSSVHDLTEEVTLLDRQASTTARLVQSLDNQLAAINLEVGSTTADLVRAEDELTAQNAILRRRLIDIYKRGPLYSVQVLLSAESFGNLLSRYKFLHLLTQRDRALVGRVEELRDEIRRQRSNLVRFQRDIALSRSEKEQEERRLRDLQQQRGRSLVRARRSTRDVEARLRRVANDERRLTNVIASLEEARLRSERASPGTAATSSTLRTSDLGRLDWPVDGTILYRFGRVVNPNNTTTRWNGIGIAADDGTAVRSVAAGRVVVAAAMGTYGQTVIVQHGGGDYSVYASLSRIAVAKDAVISKGDIVGHVGTADPDLPPHLHFEIRPQGRPVDPLDWLRRGR